MSLDRLRSLQQHLARYDRAAWEQALTQLVPETHPIDQVATRIWFSFFPLDLHVRLETADDPAVLARQLGLMGTWRLADQVDRSHRFLYGHRYWPQVKAAIASVEAPPELPALVRAVADAAARTARVDRELLLGISAAGLMTLRQAGAEAFAAAPGDVHLSPEARRRTPHQVIARRARDNSQGPLGFLRGLKKQWTVTFDEGKPDASFTAIQDQELATGAQTDKRDYRSRDSRCIPNEGPIPVECRAASCGTCWVGVLGGAEKLSPVVEHDEGRRMKVFGYLDTNEPQPLIRLACQARPAGAVSIVIPPWNGFFGVNRRP